MPGVGREEMAQIAKRFALVREPVPGAEASPANARPSILAPRFRHMEPYLSAFFPTGAAFGDLDEDTITHQRGVQREHALGFGRNDFAEMLCHQRIARGQRLRHRTDGEACRKTGEIRQLRHEDAIDKNHSPHVDIADQAARQQATQRRGLLLHLQNGAHRQAGRAEPGRRFRGRGGRRGSNVIAVCQRQHRAVMEQQADVFSVGHNGTGRQQEPARAVRQRKRQRLTDRNVFLRELPRFLKGHGWRRTRLICHGRAKAKANASAGTPAIL